MRSALIALAALSLACSGTGVATSPSDDVAGADAAASPPTITFVLAPKVVSAADDGTYTLGIVLSYVDDEEPVVSFRFDSDAATLDDAPMPSASSDDMTTLALTLPRGTAPGELTFTLCLVSQSGVESAPYSDAVFLE